MIRRHFVTTLAALALGFVVAAPAHAGGTAGAAGVKKPSTLRIKNTTTTAYYLVATPAQFASLPQTVGSAKRLGAVLINPGQTIVYPVPRGAGGIAIANPAAVNVNDPASAVTPLTTATYIVGATQLPFNIVTGPAIRYVGK